VGFETDTDEQEVKVPNTYGFYVESVVETPEEARDERVDIEEVILHYTVLKTGGFATTLAFYASLDTVADNEKGDADELLLKVDLGVEDDSVSGETESTILPIALSQEKFVVGVENLTVGLPTDETTVKFYLTVKGTYRIW